MTNQPDTWKEEYVLFGRENKLNEEQSVNLFLFLESLLSTRTALAQKEGVREAMRVLPLEDNLKQGTGFTKGWDSYRKAALQALEELIGKV